MPSPFAAAVRDASAAMDAAMGEALRLVPMASTGEFTPSSPDPARAPIDLIGIVTFRSGVMRRAGAGARTKSGVESAESGWRVSLDAAALAARGIEPRPDDHLIRLDEPGLPRFRLLAPLPVPGRVVHPMVPA